MNIFRWTVGITWWRTFLDSQQGSKQTSKETTDVIATGFETITKTAKQFQKLSLKEKRVSK